MASLNGRKLSKQELLKYCGSIDQIASISQGEFSDGKADGLKFYNVKTGGGLEYTVLPNRCMDISLLSYKGVNISFLSKNGHVGPHINMPTGDDFVNYMTGGMLFTCGLRNVGKSCEDNTNFHPLHGRIGLTPAQYAHAGCFWDQDDYILEMGGLMRETALFGVNLSLTRKIFSKLGENEIHIHDVIENNSPTAQEFMFLYHVNFGFPFLDETLEVIFPESKITPRTEIAKDSLSEIDVYTKPIDNHFERVYFRDVKDVGGIVTVNLINKDLGIGAFVEYEKENLPRLTQWKSLSSGDYALGIEPSNSGVDGVKVERENGTLLSIPPFSKLEYNLKLGFFDL